MGTQISGIIIKKEINFSDLKGKKLAIDAFNMIYQFLSTIRQYDGTPLKDSKGRVTSHLSGLFYRNINFLVSGIMPIWVFDGKPPELKEKERESRRERKIKAEEKYQEALAKKDIEGMGRYARQTVRITQEIIDQSKELLTVMGIPVIQAPGEGEAQASVMTRAHEAYATASQDYDSLLFGTPLLIRNLGLSRKRKTSTGAYVPTEIELIELEKVLNHLQINHEQLICLGILVGTDYNPGGVKGIGQKKALDIVKKKKTPVEIFSFIEWMLKERFGNNEEGKLEFDWHNIFEQFKKPKIVKSHEVEFKKINEEKVKELLCKEYEFSESRVDSALKKLKEFKKKQSQSDLEKFF